MAGYDADEDIGKLVDRLKNLKDTLNGLQDKTININLNLENVEPKLKAQFQKLQNIAQGLHPITGAPVSYSEHQRSAANSTLRQRYRNATPQGMALGELEGSYGALSDLQTSLTRDQKTLKQFLKEREKLAAKAAKLNSGSKREAAVDELRGMDSSIQLIQSQMRQVEEEINKSIHFIYTKAKEAGLQFSSIRRQIAAARAGNVSTRG
jgi:chromosome segregation ATPase